MNVDLTHEQFLRLQAAQKAALQTAEQFADLLPELKGVLEAVRLEREAFERLLARGER